MALAALTLASLVSLTGTAGAARAATTDYGFLIMGHGWGHGVGMSQWGAYGYAKHGVGYKAILKHYFTGIGFSTVGDSTVRVRLRSGVSAVKLSCPADYTAKAGGTTLAIPAGATATTTWSGGAFRVAAGSVSQTFAAAPTFTPSRGNLRLLTATDLGDTGAYRGTIRVVASGGGLMIVNHVPLESYLRGVVPHEVPSEWPAEALKAQACAARAFALGSRQPDETWDVYCDVRDQAYVGVGIEHPRTDAAVAATAGVVPTYKGRPILACYFSCSGGKTESVKYVWGGDYPYLKGVDDPYDSYGTLHDWGPVRRTSSQVDKALVAKGTPRAIWTVKHGWSPRIVKAAVLGSGGTTFVDGNSLRMKLGLNSTWVEITSIGICPAARDGATIVAGESITLSGRLYPAIKDGGSVYLHTWKDGAWHGHPVETVRTAEKLPGGATAYYSAYSVSVSPRATTRYYFSSLKAESPVTTVTVD